MEVKDALLRYEAEAAARIVALCWQLCELRSAARVAAQVSDVHRSVSGGVGWSERGDARRGTSSHGRGNSICCFPALRSRAMDGAANAPHRITA